MGFLTARRRSVVRRHALGDMVPQMSTPLAGTRAEKWQTVANALALAGASASAIPLLVTHLIQEQGRDFAGGLWNFNLGNVKLTPQQRAIIAADPNTSQFQYFWMRDRTGSTDPYQAYGSLADGLAPYMREITRRPITYAAAQAGDVAGFTMGLVSEPSAQLSYIGNEPFGGDPNAHYNALFPDMAQIYAEVQAAGITGGSIFGGMDETTSNALLLLGAAVLAWQILS